MYTSLLCLVLAGSSMVPASLRSAIWQADYRVAQDRAAEEKRPLAVFFGKGIDGQENCCKEGMPNHVLVRLIKDYVCVYVDIDSEKGQQLADEFQIRKGHGLVLSDRTGSYQAFHYDGALANADLTRCLTRFADPKFVYQGTITHPDQRSPFTRSFDTFAPSSRGRTVTRNC